MCSGTLLRENGPLMIADERIGSVGVRQAEITRADMYDTEGNSAMIMAVDEGYGSKYTALSFSGTIKDAEARKRVAMRRED